jgi:RNA polymerase sigma-70 factor (sigma-E family)
VEFEEYVRARGPALVRFAQLITGNDQHAEDLTQEVLARAYARWDRVVRTDSPDAYLRRAVVNARTSWWRRRLNRERPMDLSGVQPHRTVDGPEAAASEHDALWREVCALPVRQRAVVVLRYYEDLDDTAIANVLSCSTATVRTHAMRALAWPPAPASASRLAAPDPRAASDPTIVPATEDPTMVGRDPRLIHVGLARIPTGYRGADWSSDSGYGERISLVDQTGDERSGSIFVGRREAGLNGGIGANGPLHRVRGTTVHGHRASVLLATVPARPGQDAEQYWYVRWQERPGLWAQICGSRYSTAERLATAAQFDTDSGANRP